MASSSNRKILRRCPHLSSSSSDWSTLPPDLVLSIVTRLQSLADYIRFRSACRSWNAIVGIDRRLLPRELPWLLLPFTCSSDHQYRGFFNPFTNAHHRLFLPEVSPSHRIVGSSPSGFWVLTDGTPDMIAINPLTREKFSLPPLTTLPIVVRYNAAYAHRYLIRPLETICAVENILMRRRNIRFRKVILIRDSQDPSKFLAFAMPTECSDLAYCNQGDVSWRSLRGTHTYNKDAICFRGKVYLVGKCGSLAICEFSHDPESPPVVEFIKSEQETYFPLHHAVTHYLVDATDELLLVRKSVDLSEKIRVVKFYVFKFDWRTKEWMAMKSLENQVLFLSPQYSFAISSIAYPGWGKESIVCFKFDYRYGNSGSCKGNFKSVIYKMADGSIQEELPFYNGKLLFPIWFAPNLL